MGGFSNQVMGGFSYDFEKTTNPFDDTPGQAPGPAGAFLGPMQGPRVGVAFNAIKSGNPRMMMQDFVRT